MQMVSQTDGHGGDLAGHVDGQGINFASSADGWSDSLTRCADGRGSDLTSSVDGRAAASPATRTANAITSKACMELAVPEEDQREQQHRLWQLARDKGERRWSKIIYFYFLKVVIGQ